MTQGFIRRLAASVLLSLLVACAPPPFGATRTLSPALALTPTLQATPPLMVEPTLAPTPTLQATPPLMVEPTLAPTPTFMGAQVTPLAEILAAPERFRDQLVRLEGRGLIMATFPLCPGYVGLDERQRFVDAEGQMIVATIAFAWPEGERMHDAETLRVFEGYIRIFQGVIGCPGSAQERTVPYFEITGIVRR